MLLIFIHFRTAVDIHALGFTIPKNSTIYANLWNVNHDPDFWKDPEEFKPERFLMENGKIFKPEYFIPFSIGKNTSGVPLYKTVDTIYLTEDLRHCQYQVRGTN